MSEAPRFLFFVVGGQAGTFSVPAGGDPDHALQLSDYVRRDGVTYEFITLFERDEGIGGDAYASTRSEHLLDGGPVEVRGTEIIAISVNNSPDTIGMNVGSGFLTLLGPGQTIEDPQVDLQTLDGLSGYPTIQIFHDAFVRFEDPTDPAVGNGLDAGDRFILAFYSGTISDDAMLWDDGESMQWDDGEPMEWDS